MSTPSKPATPWKKDESTGSSDQQSLTAPADAGAAAAGAPPPDAPPDAPPAPDVVAALVKKAKTAGPKLVRMVRDSPMHPGGPTTADVPESEIGSWAMADWKVHKG